MSQSRAKNKGHSSENKSNESSKLLTNANHLQHISQYLNIDERTQLKMTCRFFNQHKLFDIASWDMKKLKQEEESVYDKICEVHSKLNCQIYPLTTIEAIDRISYQQKDVLSLRRSVIDTIVRRKISMTSADAIKRTLKVISCLDTLALVAGQPEFIILLTFILVLLLFSLYYHNKKAAKLYPSNQCEETVDWMTDEYNQLTQLKNLVIYHLKIESLIARCPQQDEKPIKTIMVKPYKC